MNTAPLQKLLAARDQTAAELARIEKLHTDLIDEE